MKRVNTSPISGMMELLPQDQAVFNQIKTSIAEVYHRHGFQAIETPTIDRNEILFAKAGGDTEKQIYRVMKTAETAEDSDQSLRFDHTVPLARYVVEHESDLSFPFQVTQIGRNFRGERAQKGRYREFYQCDVDVIGRNNLSVAYDAEVIATLYDALKSFLRPELRIRVSNRKIISGLISALNLVEKSDALFSIIDHAEKVPPEKTAEFFREELKDDNLVQILTDFININGSRADAAEALENLAKSLPEDADLALFNEGRAELDEVMDLLEQQNLKDNAVIDLLIVRGIDYYTGTVFETILPDYKQIGSVCSGGRYENLAGNYTDQSFPGVGGSIGLTRLFYVLQENGLLPELSAKKPLDFALVPLSKETYPLTFETTNALRADGKTVEIVFTDKKLGDKLTYASKIAENAMVIGEDEVKTGALKAKNFETGAETPFRLDQSRLA